MILQNLFGLQQGHFRRNNTMDATSFKIISIMYIISLRCHSNPGQGQCTSIARRHALLERVIFLQFVKYVHNCTIENSSLLIHIGLPPPVSR